MTTSVRDERRTVNITDAAKQLGVSRSLLYREVKAGRAPFPVLKLGERFLISRVVLEDVLAGKYGAPTDDRAA